MRYVLIGLLSCCLFGACRPVETSQNGASSQASESSGGVRIRVETEGNPAIGSVPVLVYVLEEGEGVSGAVVEVAGDMTHAGMVPVVVEASEREPGLYRADEFEFTMAGDWIITAEVELPGGDKKTAETSVTVPGQ